jgi:uncharacterized protein (DUF58 family)
MRASPTARAPAGRLRFTSEGLGWLAATALLGLLGGAKSLNLLLMLAYVMLGLLVLNGVFARRHANRVRARRTLPPPTFAGEPTELTVTATNAAGKPATICVQDCEREWHCAELASQGSVQFSHRKHFPQRGRLDLPPLVVASSYPFGFLRYECPDPSADSVIVLPATGTADPDAMQKRLLQTAGAEGRSRKVLRRLTQDHADVRGIRPYRTGDSIRAIHWKSSARRRELMVREYDAAPSPELLLVVDSWQPANPTRQDEANLEAALSLAATIAQTWCRHLEARITICANRTITTASAEASLREALVPLAEAVGSPKPTLPHAESFSRIALRAARLVVSSRANSPWIDALSRAIGKPFASLDPLQRVSWYQPPHARPGEA